MEKALMHQRITAMLAQCGSTDTVLPATQLYNEGWLLRLVLDFFSRRPENDHPLAFSSGCRWFSEARLPSQFFPQSRGDTRAESWTHADAVIGHFHIGEDNKGGLTLSKDATHFIVCEAKLFSPLSPGVKNAGFFDQAARNVACIAEVLNRANVPPSVFSKLGFYVIAPRSQIESGLFLKQVDKTAMKDKVSARVAQYEGQKQDWFSKWFLPALQQMEIACLSWEDLIIDIRKWDDLFGSELEKFYGACVKHNHTNGLTT